MLPTNNSKRRRRFGSKREVFVHQRGEAVTVAVGVWTGGRRGKRLPLSRVFVVASCYALLKAFKMF
jgi:hypothetical protein